MNKASNSTSTIFQNGMVVGQKSRVWNKVNVPIISGSGNIVEYLIATYIVKCYY